MLLRMLMLGAPAAALFSVAYFISPSTFTKTYPVEPSERAVRATSSGATATPPVTDDAHRRVPDIDPPLYLETPKPLKAIYMTQCVAGTPSFRAELLGLIEETELNAVVIDVKDFSGGIGFTTDHPELTPYISDRCRASDMRELVRQFNEKGIYTIARITVFQDPLYAELHPELGVKYASNPEALWTDNKGLHFIDVSAKPFWDYIITLSRETHKLGFDELNYDYIRFPSDGPMKDIHFPHSGDTPKAVALERFFAFLHEEMKNPSAYPRGVEPPVISADLFGMTTTNYDDLNIGQQLERTLPYFDYVAPMVYPSHYPAGWHGFQNPNLYPYEVVNICMETAARRAEAKTSPIETRMSEPVYETITIEAASSTAGTTTTQTKKVLTGEYTKPQFDRNKLRPWLQDFDYGGNYDVAEVRTQIQATYDAGLHSWMLWAPSNRYTRGALESVSAQQTQ